ncbi:hypothetical protein XELAEV_18027785mg [Xenopus laevis]|uniref:Uncharacterized protein n=1 Tax=Xenopus laevis TaxID=8355 RepID=A0A974HKK0_XENLA|nr:hypothetical protein XELAEV_18027785mg [Xenopus laevis]
MNVRSQEISNKCSINFMILTIECLNADIKDLAATVDKVRAEVTGILGALRAEAALAEHSEILSKLQEEIIERKIRKFHQDCRDYESGQVYTWREERYRQRSKKRTNGLHAYPSTEQQETRDTLKPKEQREQREYSRKGDRRPPHHSQKYPRGCYTAESSPYTNKEEEGPGSDREPQPFLGAGPSGSQINTNRKNPRYPIVREAYPQRQKNNGTSNKR